MITQSLKKRRWVTKHEPGALLKEAQRRFRPFCNRFWKGREDLFWDFLFPRLSGLWRLSTYPSKPLDSYKRINARLMDARLDKEFPAWFHDELAYACWRRFLFPGPQAPSSRQRGDLIAYLQTLLLVEAIQVNRPDITFVTPPYLLAPGMIHWLDIDPGKEAQTITKEAERALLSSAVFYDGHGKLRRKITADVLSCLAAYLLKKDWNRPAWKRLKNGIIEILPPSSEDGGYSRLCSALASPDWRRPLPAADADLINHHAGGALDADPEMLNEAGDHLVSLSSEVRFILTEGHPSAVFHWWPLPNLKPIEESHVMALDTIGLRMALEYDHMKALIETISLCRRYIRTGDVRCAKKLLRDQTLALRDDFRVKASGIVRKEERNLGSAESTSTERWAFMKRVERELGALLRELEGLVKGDDVHAKNGKLITELNRPEIQGVRRGPQFNSRDLALRLLAVRRGVKGQTYLREKLRAEYLPLLRYNQRWAELCISMSPPEDGCQ